ncbi:hypothetical protein ACP7H9_07775 [Idiomarina sp. ST20R2A10]|uniref:hypothetical protein n=1 Tax=Idiomarina sp. ST20R2A10 TaxID=3418369 RepID=UPI003EC5B0C6
MVNEDIQMKFGFKYGRNGAHASRTMMLAEITELFSHRPVNATAEDYQQDIEQFNLLNKPTSKARQLTWRHLIDLYGMNTEIPLFRIFRLFWEADEKARPVLACQMGLARDPLLRLSKEKILELNTGQLLTRPEMESLFAERFPDRFSPATLKSIAQNVNGTWTHAGYLIGRNKKHRSEPDIRPVNVAFALVMGHLQGASGNRLFNTEWVQMFEYRTDRLLELARLASHAGLITFKHSSEVIDIGFQDLLTREEESMLHE